MSEILGVSGSISAGGDSNQGVSDSISISSSITATGGHHEYVEPPLTETPITITDSITGNITYSPFVFHKLISRYAIYLEPIDIAVKSRYRLLGELFSTCRSSYSTRCLQIGCVTRYSLQSTPMYSAAPSRYHVYPAAVIGADPSQPLIPVSPYHVAITQNIPAVDDEITFKIINPINGQIKDLSGIPYQFTIDFGESTATTWSLSIVDPFGEFCPLNKWSTWASIMDERPFGMGGADPDLPNIVKGVLYPTKVRPQLKKQLVVEATIGGHKWTFTGIGTSWSHTRDWQSRYFNFVWKGTDFSILLNKENQSMQTIRSNSRYGIHKSAEALREILTQYGLQSDLSKFTDNWVIPVMHRSNGNPQDWVSSILQAMCYEWKMVGGTVFTPYLPCNVPQGQAASSFVDPTTGQSVSGQNNVYMYDANSNIPNFTHEFDKMRVYNESYEGSLMAIYNRVIAIRAAEGNGSEAYKETVFEFGDQYTVSFNPPLSFVSYVATAQNNGFFSNFKYYRGSELIAVREATAGAIGYGSSLTDSGVIYGATSVKFTWGVLPGGFIGTGAPGAIEFHGTVQVEPTIWGGAQYGLAIDQGPDNPAPEMRVFSENLNLIKQYGLRPIEVPASPLIPTKALLQVFANRMLYRLSRQSRKGTYKIPLNPFIEAGTLIREKDLSLGATFGTPLVRDRIVTGGSHSFSNVPSERYTTYYGNEYVTVT